MNESDFRLETVTIPDAPNYLSPEQAIVDGRKDTIEERTEKQTKLIEASLREAFPKLDDVHIQTLTAGVADKATRDEKTSSRAAASGVGVDAWGAGVAGYNFLYQRELQPGNFMAPKLDGLKAFGADTANRAIDTDSNPLGLFVKGSFHNPGVNASQEDTLIRDLLNGLLHPDPRQRLSVSDALAHPIFNEKAPQADGFSLGRLTLGSWGARALIVSILRGDVPALDPRADRSGSVDSEFEAEMMAAFEEGMLTNDKGKEIDYEEAA